MLFCGELWALSIYLEPTDILADSLGHKIDKILKFLKVAKRIFLRSLFMLDWSGSIFWYQNLILELEKLTFLRFQKIQILSPNPSKMMTLRVQILNFLCLCYASLASGHGAKHSLLFWPLILSRGRGIMPLEAFDVLQWPRADRYACTLSLGIRQQNWPDPF